MRGIKITLKSYISEREVIYIYFRLYDIILEEDNPLIFLSYISL